MDDYSFFDETHSFQIIINTKMVLWILNFYGKWTAKLNWFPTIFYETVLTEHNLDDFWMEGSPPPKKVDWGIYEYVDGLRYIR